MSYRTGWLLTFIGCNLFALLVLAFIAAAIAITHGPGPVIFAVIGILALAGFSRGFVMLWRVRPSTRPN